MSSDIYYSSNSYIMSGLFEMKSGDHELIVHLHYQIFSPQVMPLVQSIIGDQCHAL